MAREKWGAVTNSNTNNHQLSPPPLNCNYYRLLLMTIDYYLSAQEMHRHKKDGSNETVFLKSLIK